jgi:hypothetical protein
MITQSQQVSIVIWVVIAFCLVGSLFLGTRFAHSMFMEQMAEALKKGKGKNKR